jgi:hypothetical protein
MERQHGTWDYVANIIHVKVFRSLSSEPFLSTLRYPIAIKANAFRDSVFIETAASFVYDKANILAATP